MDQLSSRLLHFVSERILLSGPDGIGFYYRFIQDIYSHAPVRFAIGGRNSYVEQSTMYSRINRRDETIWYYGSTDSVLCYLCLVLDYLPPTTCAGRSNEWWKKQHEEEKASNMYAQGWDIEYLVSSVWVWVDFRKSSLIFCLVLWCYTPIGTGRHKGQPTPTVAVAVEDKWKYISRKKSEKYIIYPPKP